MNLESRASKKVARRIAAVAYERELAKALAELQDQFQQWQQGKVSPFDLSDAIHRFHDGIARDLFVTYNRLHPSHAVARAVAIGVLQRTEVAADLLQALEPAINFYSADYAAEAAPDE